MPIFFKFNVMTLHTHVQFYHISSPSLRLKLRFILFHYLFVLLWSSSAVSTLAHSANPPPRRHIHGASWPWRPLRPQRWWLPLSFYPRRSWEMDNLLILSHLQTRRIFYHLKNTKRTLPFDFIYISLYLVHQHWIMVTHCPNLRRHNHWQFSCSLTTGSCPYQGHLVSLLLDRKLPC